MAIATGNEPQRDQGEETELLDSFHNIVLCPLLERPVSNRFEKTSGKSKNIL